MLSVTPSKRVSAEAGPNGALEASATKASIAAREGKAFTCGLLGVSTSLGGRRDFQEIGAIVRVRLPPKWRVDGAVSRGNSFSDAQGARSFAPSRSASDDPCA